MPNSLGRISCHALDGPSHLGGRTPLNVGEFNSDWVLGMVSYISYILVQRDMVPTIGLYSEGFTIQKLTPRESQRQELGCLHRVWRCSGNQNEVPISRDEVSEPNYCCETRPSGHPTPSNKGGFFAGEMVPTEGGELPADQIWRPSKIALFGQFLLLLFPNSWLWVSEIKIETLSSYCLPLVGESLTYF